MRNIIRLSYFLFCVLTTINAKSQDTLFIYPSMAEVEPTVTASIAHQNGSYEYSYIVANGATASQKVWIFMVRIEATIQAAEAPTNWDASRASRPNVTTVAWAAYDSSYFISPGGSFSNFRYHSYGLPKIQTFYVVGRVEPPEGEFLIAPGSNDIFINSAQGRTIGPADPPTPFNALTFLDTIKSYITQSRALGWITNDPTANKYTRLIDTARFHLQANNRGVTKAKLESVLVSVSPDSAAGLITSEAYALLRFNTEYVLKKLRE